MVGKANDQFEESCKIQEHQGNKITNTSNYRIWVEIICWDSSQSDKVLILFLKYMYMLLFILVEHILQIDIVQMF